MGRIRPTYWILLLVAALSLGAYFYFVPKPAQVDVNTVIATPQPSAPPTDKKELLRRAMAGDTDAQCRLAGRFIDGSFGLPYNPILAYYWASLSASKHDPCGINNLANLYNEGVGVPRDTKPAIQLYQLAASLGDTSAMFNLGLAYQFGDGVDKNIVTALEWYKKAGDRGCFEALRQLGEIYAWGEGVPINVDRSSAYLLRANPIHDGPTAYDLGWLYYSYYPRKERCERTIHWLTISANQGDDDGKTMLGWLYDLGVCGEKTDARLAAKWYLKAIPEDALAERSYATLLWNGRLGPPNKALALRYARDAALKGDEGGLYMLAFAYDHGDVVPQNHQVAWEYYSAAAELGEPISVGVVAGAYLKGVRVKQDKARGYGMLLAMKSLGAYIPDEQHVRSQLTQAELAKAQRYGFFYAALIKKESQRYPWIQAPVSHGTRVD